MPTTPPPLSTFLHTPPTPLHGAKYDHYEPYGTRRSTRSSTRLQQDNHQSLKGHTFSPPSSAQSSPQTRIRKVIDPTDEGDSSPRTNLSVTVEIASKERVRDVSGRLPADGVTTIPPTTMLPTPAKTPRKRPQQPAHVLRSTARVLFPTRDDSAEGAMISPRKKRGGKRLGLSLDGDEVVEDVGENHIEIFTDSKERIPELDASENNPFYVHVNRPEGQTQGPRTTSKRKAPPRSLELDNAVNRDDGMVYVFRGKKMFRKYEEDNDDSNETRVTRTGSPEHRPFTRSSIKPRLLFPTEEQRREREEGADTMDVDEEAITDIDEHALDPNRPVTVHSNDPILEYFPNPLWKPIRHPSTSSFQASADNNGMPKTPSTPVTPLVSPLTPHFVTAHTTRSTTSCMTRSSTKKATEEISPSEETPSRQAASAPQPAKPGKKTRAIAGWKRTKANVLTRGKKRRAETPEREGVSTTKKAKTRKA